MKLQRGAQKPALPTALMRYMLSFLEVDVELVTVLCMVSRGWRAMFTTPGAIRTCSIYLGHRDAIGIRWLGGVSRLQAETHGCEELYSLDATHAKTFPCERLVRHWRIFTQSIQRLPMLHTLILHMVPLVDLWSPQDPHKNLFAPLGALQVLDLKFFKIIKHPEQSQLHWCPDQHRRNIDLKPLVSLHTLTLRHAHLNNFSDWAALTALTSLHLDHTDVTVDWLLSLTRLRECTLEASTILGNRHYHDTFHERGIRVLDLGGIYPGRDESSVEYALAASHHRGYASLTLPQLHIAHPDVAAIGHHVRDLTLSPHDSDVQNLPPMLSVFPHTHALTIDACGTFRDEELMQLTQLQSLTLSYSRITIDGLRPLANLHTLSVDEDTMLSVALLTQLTGLRALKLTHNRCNNATIAHDTIAKLTNLEELEIQSEFVTDSTLQQLTRLRVLYLPTCNNVTDAGIGRLTLLEDLDISYCSQVRGDCLSLLPALRHFWCYGRYGREKMNVEALFSMRWLKRVSVDKHFPYEGLQYRCRVDFDGNTRYTYHAYR